MPSRPVQALLAVEPGVDVEDVKDSLPGGEDFNIVNAEGDAQAQQTQAEQAIADDASVILLTSLDTGSGSTIIDTAEEAGVQVVEYDRFNTGGSGGAGS